MANYTIDKIKYGDNKYLLKDHGIATGFISVDTGVFNKLIATTLDTKTATIDDLKATNATIVGLLDVQGQMQTNSWTNSNIATIDGSFYICPTISSEATVTTSGTTQTSNNKFLYNGSTIVLTGSWATTGSLYLDTAAANWNLYSKVMITGEVLIGNEWTPIGTIRGVLQGINTSSGTITIGSLSSNITVGNDGTINSLPAILSLVTSGTTYNARKLKVSLYEYNSAGTSSGATNLIGIMMTTAGTHNLTYIDIYNGLNSKTSYTSTIDNTTKATEPMVRIGNLNGLPNIVTGGGNDTKPTGWGIYTTNGFFKGKIVARQGKIGDGSAAWTIGNDGNNRAYIYSGIQNITTSGSTTGIYVGTNGISNYNSSTQYVNLTGGKITAQGADIAGKITANSGSIGGWNIGTDTNKSLYYGNQTPGATTTNLVLSSASATNSNAIGGSPTGQKWFISAGKVFGVTTAGAMYATSGKIGGWTIGTSSLYNNKNSYNASNSGIYIGTDYIAGGAGNSWWIKSDGQFQFGGTGGITYNGSTLSVPAATITGTLSANNIDANSLSVFLTPEPDNVNNGVRVHAINNPELNYSLINAEGLEVYQKNENESETSRVAKFGEETIIGKTENNSYIKLADGIIQLFNNEGAGALKISTSSSDPVSQTRAIQTVIQYITYSSNHTYTISLELDSLAQGASFYINLESLYQYKWTRYYGTQERQTQFYNKSLAPASIEFTKGTSDSKTISLLFVTGITCDSTGGYYSSTTWYPVTFTYNNNTSTITINTTNNSNVNVDPFLISDDTSGSSQGINFKVSDAISYLRIESISGTFTRYPPQALLYGRVYLELNSNDGIDNEIISKLNTLNWADDCIKNIS